MESKQEKVEMLQSAIKQLIEEEKRSYKDVLVADGDNDCDHRLLSKLLTQVEALREPELCDDESSRKKDFPESEVGQVEKTPPAIKEKCSCSTEEGKEEEIVKELRKVRRQNLITHCLLSAMIVLTVTWQLSEVSMILKVKNRLTHPLRSIGDIFTGMLKGSASASASASAPARNGKEVDEKQHGQNTVIQAAVTGIKIPELPHFEFPSLDLYRE